MKAKTRQQKKATQAFKESQGDSWMTKTMYEIISHGKQALDAAMLSIGQIFVETILRIEREEIAGPDYHPQSKEIRKWASQPGSVFLGDQKIKIDRPRVRGPEGEILLKSYEKMKHRGGFSEELLAEVLRGISARTYRETVTGAAHAFGVSPSAISQHLVEATAHQLKEFQERRLDSFRPFAMLIDTIHRGGQAFIVALGIDENGDKKALGFWEGATENHVICEEMLSNMESRGLALSSRILWITDGGKGTIKALKARYGKALIHQRCTIHKDRNIQKHLPKRYRKEAHRRYRIALEQNSYENAKKMLEEFEGWLREINESAADSLLEAFEELLTLHKLKAPAQLRKALHSTNGIESMFSMVRDCEGKIKRYRNSKMRQRWLAAVLLHCEKKFRRVKGYEYIKQAIDAIDAYHAILKEERMAA
jgi:putative transposase